MYGVFTRIKLSIIVAIAWLLTSGIAITAQEPEQAPSPADIARILAPTDLSGEGFHFGMLTAARTLPDQTIGEDVSFLSVSIAPYLRLGDFFAELDILFNLRFPTGDTPIAIRAEDWIPSAGEDIGLTFEKYLGSIRTIRYGQQSDPLFIDTGALQPITLGSSSFFSQYRNRRFYPERRAVGSHIIFDTQLFDFPFFRLEAIAGNWTALDIFGARAHFEPLFAIDDPSIKYWQLGFSFAADFDPYNHRRYDPLWIENGGVVDESNDIIGWGIDLVMPLLENSLNQLTVYTSFNMFINNNTFGGQIGVDLLLFNFLIFEADAWIRDGNFTPHIFDQDYDIYRTRILESISGENEPGVFSWELAAGATIFDRLLTFKLLFDGRFEDEASFDIGAEATLDRELLSLLSIQARYLKRNISELSQFAELADTIIDIRVFFGISFVQVIFELELQSLPYEVEGENWEIFSEVGLRFEI